MRMSTSLRNAISDLVKLRQEHEHLQEMINFLKMDNFEYALRCNRIENAVEKIENIVHTSANQFAEASTNLYKIMEISKSNNIIKNTDVKTSFRQSDRNLSKSNRAQLVAPHMVNGTVLKIPTINLTRLSDLSALTRNQSKDSQNSTLKDSIHVSSSMQNSVVKLSGENFSDANNSSSLVLTQDLNEPSTSQSRSHSTVLSGTFREVKIYLNQISEDSLSPEESGQSETFVTRRSKSRCSRIRKRSCTLPNTVTNRRKRRK